MNIYYGGMKVPIRISYDEETDVWIAVGEDIGLVLESESYEELMKKVRIAVPEMIETNNVKN